MIVFPHAKINLGLNVTEKRSDGFHNIESILYPVNLKDALEIIPAKDKKTDFFQFGEKIPKSDKPNLCIQAYSVLEDKYKLPPVKIYLYKKIPAGAGLGGGSSNAAFTLKALNKMFELGIDSELTDYAAKLGSDCAFFVYEKPKLAKGRGEVLSDINVSVQSSHIVLIKPPIHINTAEAYSLVEPAVPEKSIEKIINQDISTWKDELKNDFEGPVFNKYPYIKKIKETLYNNGAFYSSLSGSGSSVYGLFKNKVSVSWMKLFKDCFVFESEINSF